MITPPQPAPLWRRFAAGVISGLFGLTLLAAIGGLAALVVVKAQPAARRLRLDRFAAARGKALADGWKRSTERHRNELFVWSLLGGIKTRDSRSPGQRIMRLRRVDARTGGPMTVGSAVIRFCAARLWLAGAARVTAPIRRREQERWQALGPASVKDRRVRPTSCWLWIVAMAAPLVPALVKPRYQSLFDRLAGTVVIVDRGVRSEPATPTSE